MGSLNYKKIDMTQTSHSCGGKGIPLEVLSLLINHRGRREKEIRDLQLWVSVLWWMPVACAGGGLHYETVSLASSS